MVNPYKMPKGGPSPSMTTPAGQSKGLLDDFAVRKVLRAQEIFLDDASFAPGYVMNDASGRLSGGNAGGANTIRNAWLVVSQDGSGDFNGNDETPINAALAAVAATGGGTVLLKEGTYTIATTKITIPVNCSLVGEGRAVSIIKAGNAFAGAEVVYINSDHCQLRSLKVDGNATANGRSYNNITLYTSADYCLVDDVWVTDVAKNGINSYGTYNTIRNCRCSTWGINAVGDGIIIYDGTYCKIESCFAEGGARALANGIAAYSPTTLCHDIIISNSIVTGNTQNHGFNIERAYRVKLIGCESYSNQGAGFNTTDDNGSNLVYDVSFIGCISHTNVGAGFQLDRGRKINLIGCTAGGNTLEGIRVGGSSAVNQVTVTGCTINNNTASGFKGFNTSTAQFYSFTNCIFDTNGNRGLALEDTNDVTVSGCTVMGSTSYGIEFGGDRVSVIGNMVNTNGTQGILVNVNASAYTVSGNSIYLNVGHGLRVNASGGLISNNVLVDNSSGADGGSAISTAASMSHVTFLGNRAYDTRGTKYQDYGLNIGATNDYIIVVSNNFNGNGTSGINGSEGANGVNQHNIV
jgi:hypothetical protein